MLGAGVVADLLALHAVVAGHAVETQSAFAVLAVMVSGELHRTVKQGDGHCACWQTEQVDVPDHAEQNAAAGAGAVAVADADAAAGAAADAALAGDFAAPAVAAGGAAAGWCVRTLKQHDWLVQHLLTVAGVPYRRGWLAPDCPA